MSDHLIAETITNSWRHHSLPEAGKNKLGKLNVAIGVLSSRSQKMHGDEIDVIIILVSFCRWALQNSESYESWQVKTNQTLRQGQRPVRQIARHALDVLNNDQYLKDFIRQIFASFCDFAVVSNLDDKGIREELDKYASVQDWYRKSEKNHNLGRPAQSNADQKLEPEAVVEEANRTSSVVPAPAMVSDQTDSTLPDESTLGSKLDSSKPFDHQMLISQLAEALRLSDVEVKESELHRIVTSLKADRDGNFPAAIGEVFIQIEEAAEALETNSQAFAACMFVVLLGRSKST